MSEINKAVTMLYTKEDCGAFCSLHMPLVETVEMRIGRGPYLRKASLPFPVDCVMCVALAEVSKGGVS